MNESGAQPLISVAIPTRDRAELLEQSLASLVDQTLPKDEFEVIVADDGSTDGTRELCERFARSLPLRYERIAPSGIAAAKNAGLFASTGWVVLFFDDDDVAHPDMLKAHVEAHRAWLEPRIAILGYTTWHPRLEVTPVMEYMTEIGQNLFSYPGIEPGKELDFTHFWGGRASAKRAFLLEHGAFNQDFTFGYEDIDLGFRLSKYGFAVVYWPDAVSYMVRPISFDAFCERCERQGRSLRRLGSLHRDDPVIQRYCEVDPSDFEAEELGRTLKRTRELELQLSRGDAAGGRADLLAVLHDNYQRAFQLSLEKGLCAGNGDDESPRGPAPTAPGQRRGAGANGTTASRSRRQTLQGSAEGQSTELVFVHIPKTAGSAFRKLLQELYPPHWETLFDDEDGQELARFEKVVGRPPRVLTGHLPAATLLPRAPRARSVVWLREPVARTISTYFYWRSQPVEGDPRHASVLAGDTSLLEFAAEHANSYTHYWLAGYDLEDFDFVGVVERSDEDIREMATLLGWQDVELERVNKTTSAEYLSFDPSPELLSHIRELNGLDCDLYQRALDLRQRRAPLQPRDGLLVP